jgi:hypothetical protein
MASGNWSEQYFINKWELILEKLALILRARSHVIIRVIMRYRRENSSLLRTNLGGPVATLVGVCIFPGCRNAESAHISWQRS